MKKTEKQPLLWEESTLDRITACLKLEKTNLKELLAAVGNQEEVLRRAVEKVDSVYHELLQLGQKDIPGLFFDETDFADSEIYGHLCDRFGTKVASEIAEEFQGTSLYIPKNIFINKKHQQIRKEYRDGSTYETLARRHGYSESHIRYIIHVKKKPGKKAV